MEISPRVAAVRRSRAKSRLPAVILSVLALAAGAAARAENRTGFPHSIKQVAAESPTLPPHRPRIRRKTLLAGEKAATLDFEIGLGMRNFAELQGRIAAGELVPAEEMTERYFPT